MHQAATEGRHTKRGSSNDFITPLIRFMMRDSRIKVNNAVLNLDSLADHSVVPYPIHTQSGQNRPDNFENIFLTKALSGKYLKEKC